MDEKMKMMMLPTKGVMFAEPVEIEPDKIAPAIGAELFEIVRPVAFAEMGRRDLVLLVDESGAIKGRNMNPCASELYGWRRHGVRIYGDALIAKEVENEDGCDIAGLDDDDIDELYGIMYSV